MVPNNGNTLPDNALPFESHKKCPITGFPIIEKPAWTDIALADGYSVTFKTIGNRILLIIPKGKCGKYGISRLIEEKEKVILSMELRGRKYAELKDYGYVNGPVSMEGRKQFKDYLIRKDRDNTLVGFWGFNAGFMVKLYVNSGKLCFKGNVPIQIVGTYEEAVKNAIRAIEREDILLSGQNVNSAQRIWNIELDGITCQFKVLGKDIIFYKASGDLKKEHVALLARKYKQVLEESGVAQKGSYYEIADWAGLGISNWNARKLLIENYRILHQKYNCKVYVVFGLNSFLFAFVMISRQFFAVPMIIAKSYIDALGIVERYRRKQAVGSRAKALSETMVTGEKFYGYIDELLKYIGAISWGLENNSIKEKAVDNSHPFKHVFESLVLVKTDYDSILSEKEKAENEAAAQSKFNSLRADIWKMASDKSLSENDLIQKLLDKTGPALRVSRACYNKFARDGASRGDLETVLEWCDKDIKPTKGQRISVSLIRHLMNKDFFVLTQESALEFVPAPFRVVAKPIIAGLAASQDLEYVAVLPFFVDNKMEGWFTFDVCMSSKSKPELTDNIRDIAYEVVNILSSRIYAQKTEKALLRAASQWRATFDAMRDPVVILDRDGGIVRCNSAMQKMINKPWDEIIGHSFRGFVHDCEEHIKDCPFVKLMNTGHTENQIYHIGGKWFNITVDPILDESNNLIGAVHAMSDITDSKNAAVALEKAYGDLEIKVEERTKELRLANDRLRATELFKENLVNMVAHDMKNLLMNITAGMTYLEDDLVSANEETKRDISLVKTSADDLIRMISNMIDISRMEDNKLTLNQELVEFNAIVSSAVGAQGILAKINNKTIETKIDTTSALDVYTDPGLMQRVIINLLNNAIVHSNTGSTVRVSTFTDMSENMVKFRIESEGNPIPEQLLEKIFDKFEQIKPGKEGPNIGKGLGLAFCKMATESNGGRIWAETDGVKSNRFIFTLPLPR